MTKLITINTADRFKVSRCFDAALTVLTERHAGTDNPRAGASYHYRDQKGNLLQHLSGGLGTESQFNGWNRNIWVKTGMLLQHPEHRLSWQSHNMEALMYPGGKRDGHGGLGALSGFKWQEDECAVHCIDLELERDDESSIREMLEISDNSYWTEIHHDFKRALRLQDG